MDDYFTSEKVFNGEVELNSCGIQKISNHDWHVKRVRKDYTVMYIAMGKATLIKGKEKIPVNEGEAMFFPPKAEQNYFFLCEDNSINKFVHFSGTLACPLENGGGRKITISNVKDFTNAIEGLVRSYNGISEQRENLQNGYLRIIIALLMASERSAGGEKSKLSPRMTDALNYIHINAFSKVDLDHAASICYLSRDRFNHVFKENIGLSPNDYIMKLRIERSKMLLRDLGTSVRECAECTGFSDVNYFCRVFKKKTGMSPRKYAVGEDEDIPDSVTPG